MIDEGCGVAEMAEGGGGLGGVAALGVEVGREGVAGPVGDALDVGGGV